MGRRSHLGGDRKGAGTGILDAFRYDAVVLGVPFTPSAQVSVSERGQSLPVALVRGIETLVDQHPWPSASTNPMSGCATLVG